MKLSFGLVSLQDQEHCSSAFNLLKQLRPLLTESQFQFLIVEASQSQGHYRLMGAWNESHQLVSVVGIRTWIDFLHGKHWYIDDLVTDHGVRSQGIGAEFLGWIEDTATREGITCIRLSTGAQHEAGKRFYEKNHWSLMAVTYKKFRTPNSKEWSGEASF